MNDSPISPSIRVGDGNYFPGDSQLDKTPGLITRTIVRYTVLPGPHRSLTAILKTRASSTKMLGTASDRKRLGDRQIGIPLFNGGAPHSHTIFVPYVSQCETAMHIRRVSRP